MKDLDKIKKLTRLKNENPELFEQLIRENYEKNPEWRKLLDSLPVEQSSDRLGMTWLDRKLMQNNGMTEESLIAMSPSAKVELFLNNNDIYGYTEDILRAVSDAYGVKLPI